MVPAASHPAGNRRACAGRVLMAKHQVSLISHLLFANKLTRDFHVARCCVKSQAPKPGQLHRGKRREVEPHSARGTLTSKEEKRYLRRFLAGAPGYSLLTTLQLTGEPDPELAMASKTQHARRRRERFNLLNFGSPAEVLNFAPALALAA